MNEILLLKGPLVERIWGCNYFKNTLNITESDEKYGELWTVSALESNESVVINGKYKNQPLSKVYKEHPELFNNPKEVKFPILVKVIATGDKLSVQVHPNDDYASKYENALGKTEGWLILDCDPDATIVMGHNAKNKEELTKYIENDDYANLLKYTKVKKGDFYPINSGTIHAIGKGIILLEVQQSSDLTYRFYDYHRKDKNGNERELHVKKAIDVTTYNQKEEKTINVFNDNVETIWDNQYFKVNCYEVKDSLKIDYVEDYLIVSIIEGEFIIDGIKLHLGDSFIITSNSKDVIIKGNGKLVTTQNKKG